MYIRDDYLSIIYYSKSWEKKECFNNLRLVMVRLDKEIEVDIKII